MHAAPTPATLVSMMFRTTPTAAGRHLFSRFLLFVALVSTAGICVGETTGSPSTGTEAEYAEQLKRNEAQIAQLLIEVENTAQQRIKMLETLKQAQAAGDGREQRIQSLQKDIATYESRVDELDQLVSSPSNQLSASKTLLKNVIQTSVRLRASTGLQVMLQHDDAALASRLGVYYDYFFRAQAAIIEKTTAQLSSVRDAQTEALKSRNWLQHLKRKASGQRADFAAAEVLSRAGIKQVEGNLQAKQQSVETLKNERAQLARLLEELRKDALGASGQFLAHKGKYPWPVNGTLSAKFGDTKSIGKLKWSGIVIESDAGSAVKAIADGEIVYADWLQGFGMLVIMDHGDNYMTLYGGNRDLQVHAGDWVEFGATIATVGGSVGQNKPGLYFEIRHNAKPVNPEAWISLKNSF